MKEDILKIASLLGRKIVKSEEFPKFTSNWKGKCFYSHPCESWTLGVQRGRLCPEVWEPVNGLVIKACSHAGPQLLVNMPALVGNKETAKNQVESMLKILTDRLQITPGRQEWIVPMGTGKARRDIWTYSKAWIHDANKAERHQQYHYDKFDDQQQKYVLPPSSTVQVPLPAGYDYDVQFMGVGASVYESPEVHRALEEASKEERGNLDAVKRAPYGWVDVDLQMTTQDDFSFTMIFKIHLHGESSKDYLESDEIWPPKKVFLEDPIPFLSNVSLPNIVQWMQRILCQPRDYQAYRLEQQEKEEKRKKMAEEHKEKKEKKGTNENKDKKEKKAKKEKDKEKSKLTWAEVAAKASSREK